MKTFLLLPAIMLLLWSSVAPVLSQEPPGKADPILTDLQGRLERAFADLKPAPQFDIPAADRGKSLHVHYQTRTYQIYPDNKAGRLGRELVEREGPDDEGFLLKVHLQPEGEVNQAVVPQTIRAPYWKTFLNVYPVADSDRQIYMALSYRGRTDQALIERIQTILKKLVSTPEDPEAK